MHLTNQRRKAVSVRPARSTVVIDIHHVVAPLTFLHPSRSEVGGEHEAARLPCPFSLKSFSLNKNKRIGDKGLQGVSLS